MADNLTTTTTVSTIPNGTVIATDDAGAGGHVQIVKLAISTDGSATAIPAEATNGLDVDVTRVIPGTSATHLGKAEDAQHASGDTGVMALAVFSSADSNLAGTNLDYVPLQTDDSGFLKTNVKTITPGTTSTALGKAEDAAHSSGDTGVMMLAVRQSTQADFGADGDYVPLSIDDDGGVRVSVIAGGGTGGTAVADDADFTAGTTPGTPAMGVYESTPTNVTDGDLGTIGITQDRRVKTSAAISTMANLTESLVDDAAFTPGTSRVVPIGFEFDDSSPDTVNEGDIGAGRMSANRNIYTTLRDAAGNERGANVDASNQLQVLDGNSASALTALQLIDNPVLVDDAAFTPATSSVMMAGFQADESSTDSVDEGDAGAPRMTLDRKVIVTPQPHAAGGLSIHRSIDLDEGTLEVVKNSPGQVYGMWVTNTATATRWIKFYDATSGTAGTGTPVITIGIPGNSSDDIAGNFGPGGMGIAFGTGICVGATTGVADADTGAPGANDVIVNIFFK